MIKYNISSSLGLFGIAEYTNQIRIKAYFLPKLERDTYGNSWRTSQVLAVAIIQLWAIIWSRRVIPQDSVSLSSGSCLSLLIIPYLIHFNPRSSILVNTISLL